MEMEKKHMYELKKRKNVRDKVISDFGGLLDHIESEQERLLKSSYPGYVEILDTDSEKTVMLTLPHEGDIVHHLETIFDMEEASEDNSKTSDEGQEVPGEPQEIENMPEEDKGWEQFAEPATNSSSNPIPNSEPVQVVETTLIVKKTVEPDAEIASERSFHAVSVGNHFNKERYGLISQKLVGDNVSKAEQLRQHLLSEIRKKEEGFIHVALEKVEKQLAQKQNIYNSLMTAAKTVDDIDGLIGTANELVELQMKYDNVLAQVE